MFGFIARRANNFMCIMHRYNNCNRIVSSSCIGVQKFSFHQNARTIHTGSVYNGIMFPTDDTTLWGRTLRKLGFTDIPKSVLKGSAYLMYIKTADSIDHSKFFELCGLPDTYASWFIVLELHVWMLSARLMQEGKEGKIARHHLVKAMWEDHETKSKKLEGAIPAARKKQLQILNEQFHAALIAYDEGLQGDDYILAGALWRRFLLGENYDCSQSSQDFESSSQKQLISKVKALEMLVIYVRAQFLMLNNLSREQLIRKRAFKWAPFDDNLYTLAVKAEKTVLPVQLEKNKLKAT